MAWMSIKVTIGSFWLAVIVMNCVILSSVVLIEIIFLIIPINKFSFHISFFKTSFQTCSTILAIFLYPFSSSFSPRFQYIFSLIFFLLGKISLHMNTIESIIVYLRSTLYSTHFLMIFLFHLKCFVIYFIYKYIYIS